MSVDQAVPIRCSTATPAKARSRVSVPRGLRVPVGNGRKGDSFWIIAWHPLRTLNAINVRVLGADLLTVHVQLGA